MAELILELNPSRGLPHDPVLQMGSRSPSCGWTAGMSGKYGASLSLTQRPDGFSSGDGDPAHDAAGPRSSQHAPDFGRPAASDYRAEEQTDQGGAQAFLRSCGLKRHLARSHVLSATAHTRGPRDPLERLGSTVQAAALREQENRGLDVGEQ